MFVRTKCVQSGGRKYQYLQVVETRREGNRVLQHVVANFGRLEQFVESGNLDSVIRGLVKHSKTLQLLEKYRGGTLEPKWDKLWGPCLVFQRLWEELGMPELLRRLVRTSRLAFDFERVVFALTLQRILRPGSDRAGAKWIRSVYAEGFESLRLEHFYRALGVLWKKKEEIERALYERGRDLFNQPVDLVFFDTTSVYYEGESAFEDLLKRGRSKDHRPENRQFVLGFLMRRDGLPIGCEIWPGNTADVTRLTVIAEVLKRRFGIEKVVVVCDRGMVSKKNLAELSEAGFDYIVGVKMRGVAEVRDEVLGRAGRYEIVAENLQVKEVRVEDRRYVVCFNPDEAEKARRDREKIVEELRKKLADGGLKKLIPNRGYRRYLKVTGGTYQIDEERIEREARFDGKYILRTTTTLSAAEVALAYKNLTWIERLFREAKSLLGIRPVFHHKIKDNLKGHAFACFLALYMVVVLRKKIEALGGKPEWNDLIEDLSAIRAIALEVEGQLYLLRTQLTGSAHWAFKATGLRPPPLAQPLGPGVEAEGAV